jgi:hypothetical protein
VKPHFSTPHALEAATFERCKKTLGSPWNPDVFRGIVDPHDDIEAEARRVHRALREGVAAACTYFESSKPLTGGAVALSLEVLAPLLPILRLVNLALDGIEVAATDPELALFNARNAGAARTRLVARFSKMSNRELACASILLGLRSLEGDFAARRSVAKIIESEIEAVRLVRKRTPTAESFSVGVFKRSP